MSRSDGRRCGGPTTTAGEGGPPFLRPGGERGARTRCTGALAEPVVVCALVRGVVSIGCLCASVWACAKGLWCFLALPHAWHWFLGEQSHRPGAGLESPGLRWALCVLVAGEAASPGGEGNCLPGAKVGGLLSSSLCCVPDGHCLPTPGSLVCW